MTLLDASRVRVPPRVTPLPVVVMLLPTNWTVAPAMTVNVLIVAELLASVTVALAMTTSSPEPGTWDKLQFPAVFQLLSKALPVGVGRRNQTVFQRFHSQAARQFRSVPRMGGS